MLFVELTVFLNIFLEINFPVLRYFLATFALYYFISGIWQERLRWRNPISKYYFVLSILLIFWSFYLIARGIPKVTSGYSNHIYLKQFISGQLLLYLIPLLLLIKPDEILVKKLFRYSFIMTVLYLVILLPSSILIGIGYDNSHFVEQSAYFFAAPAGILLLTSPFHSGRVKVISFITSIIALAIMAYLARRSSVAYYGGILLFSLLLINFSQTAIVNRTRVMNLLNSFLLTLIVIVLLSYNLDKFSYLAEKSSEGFSNRDLVFLEFFSDMNKNSKDWIVGRGINGTFKSALLAKYKSYNRDSIENGYLHAILKGGYIYLSLILILSFGAIINGFFRSKNLLTKACAAYILIQLIEMIGFGLPSLTVKYLFFWLAIGLCYYKPLLYKSDLELKPIIGLR